MADAKDFKEFRFKKNFEEPDVKHLEEPDVQTSNI